METFHESDLSARTVKRVPHLIFLCLVLGLLTFLASGQVLGSQFLGYDDQSYITENPAVKGGLSAAGIRWALTNVQTGNWHPVTWLSHMLDAEIFGIRPAGHHFTSLLFHLINSFLVFFWLSQMTGAVYPSWFVALLFAVHPLHVESVAWVSERKDVLSTFFWLLAMMAYGRYVRLQSKPFYILCVLFFVLGLAAKPMVVTLPFVLLLLDYWPLRRMSSCTSFVRLIREKIPFILLTVVFCFLTAVTQDRANAMSNFEEMPLRLRLGNALVSYVIYLWKMIWPLDLTIFYPHPGKNLQIGKVLGAFGFLTVTTLWMVLRTRKYPYLGTGWFWYLGTLVPVIGLIQVGAHAYADRFTYVPLLGIFVLLTWGLADLGKRWNISRDTRVILGAVIIGLCCVLTWFQTRYWYDDEKLFRHALKVTKNNHVAESGLGLILADRGRFEEAIPHMIRSVEIAPKFYQGHNNLGLVLRQVGELEGARFHLMRAVTLAPQFYQAYNNLGNVLFAERNYQGAIDHYKKSIQIKPDYDVAHYNSGVVYREIGHYQEAKECFARTKAINPNYPGVHANFAQVSELLERSQQQNES